MLLTSDRFHLMLSELLNCLHSPLILRHALSTAQCLTQNFYKFVNNKAAVNTGRGIVSPLKGATQVLETSILYTLALELVTRV